MIGQLPNCWWVFVLLGIFAGVISGTLGLGSGTVIIPALVLLCSFKQKSAQGIALAVMVPMALVGAIRYWKNPEIEIDAEVIALIVLGALAGVLAGTELVNRLPGNVLQKVFAIFLVIVAVQMFTASLKPEKRDVGESLTNQQNVNLGERGGTMNEAPKQ
ncbi:MAG TPA: sulfite exporter TauE/SafE family protein [Sedimentisphaerales bacterium]|nr:sulfite exporter TauE/SafE family protein [Sedimentisphaerales bacterium]